jgi:restriction endonuclease S subunit
LKEKLEKTKIPLFELKDLVKTKITSGATPLIDKEYLYYTTKDVGIPFLRVRDLEEGYINLQDVKYIYKDVHDKMLKRSKLKPNDVLLSIAGTIGLSTVVPEDLKEANINQALARIRLKESIKVNSKLIKIDPYYISAFLNSYFGKIQTERLSRPGAQANINLPETESILIPIVDYQKQKEIGQKFKESIEMKKESKTRLIENNKILMKII